MIRGHAELLRADAVEPESREGAGFIFDASVRLAGLCEDVIDFLRLPAAAPGGQVPFSLSELGAGLRPVAAKRGVQLHIIEPDAAGGPAFLHSSARRVVGHVLEHVVRNADVDVNVSASFRPIDESPPQMCMITASPVPAGVLDDGDAIVDGTIAIAARILAAHRGYLDVAADRLEMLVRVSMAS